MGRNTSKWIVLSVATVGMVFTVLYLFATPGSDDWQVDAEQASIAQKQGQASIASAPTLTVSESIIQGDPSLALPNDLATIDAEEETAAALLAEEDPYIEKVIAEQMLQIKDLYAETSRYPDSSQPITWAESAEELDPNRYFESEMPFFIEGLDEPIQLSAKLDRYQYFAGDPVTIEMTLGNLPSGASVSGWAVLATLEQDTSLRSDLNSANASSTQLTAQLDTSILPREQSALEMVVKLYVLVDEYRLFHTLPLQFANANAELIDILDSQIAQEYLNIPMQMQVYQPGYYYVTANLYDAQTNKPLVQLETEGRLEADLQELSFNAHVHALQSVGSDGPYYLQDFKITRGAEIGEQFDTPGRALEPRYPVQGYPFSEFQDIPYVNADKQDTLCWMARVSGEEDSNCEPS